MNAKAHCPACNKEVDVFKQSYSTIPVDVSNMVRKWSDVICAYCGCLIVHEYVDEPSTK